MSYKASSRHSTPPTSTRSKQSPKPPRSPQDVRLVDPVPAAELNLTLFGVSAPMSMVRPRAAAKTRNLPVTVPPPPSTPVDEYFFTSETIVLKSATPLEKLPPAHRDSPIPDVVLSARSHRSVSPLDFSALDRDNDDNDVIETKRQSAATETSETISKSMTISEMSTTTATSTSEGSSLVTISGHSTQSCSSLPCDDSTSKSQSSDVVFNNAERSPNKTRNQSQPRSNAGSCGSCDNSSNSSPAHRRFILERLESGYYSPDTTDIRFSVAEILEAADCANRLASLLDQVLGRELGFEPTNTEPQRSVSLSPNMLRHAEVRSSMNAAVMYEQERRQFFENIGGHPSFHSVCRKIELFESGNPEQTSSDEDSSLVTRYFPNGIRIERKNGPPLPPPLPYEGFKTVHDGKCHCCGPRVLQFSPGDLQRQRSLLRKVTEKEREAEENEEDGSAMNLQQILKSVITKRRDVVRPIEENISGRSDWSVDESIKIGKR